MPECQGSQASPENYEQWLLAVEAARLVGFGSVHRSLQFCGSFPEIERSLSTIATTGSCRRSCLICGPVGVGKTALLSAMFKAHVLEILERTTAGGLFVQSARRIRFPVLVAMESKLVTHEEIVQAAHAEYQADEIELSLAGLAKVRLLMIDDLGDTTNTEYHQVKLDGLIDERWRNNRSTWITTNLSANAIERWSGWERIASRFADKNWMSRYELPGKDLRKEAPGPGKATK